jgi:tetratricopeptide (TPR) repeat protein
VSQALFIQARELIRDKRYDEARALLREIDHPTAREWLAKLDKLAPEPPAPYPRDQLLAVRELLTAKRFDEARALLREIDHPAAREWLAKLDKLAPEPPAPAPSLREQLLAARELLAAKRYDEARALLREIDHPTAREWLVKVDKLAPEPVTDPPVPAAQHDEIVREAQRLLLQGEYDRVREMLKPLNTRVAAFWRDKTAVNQFRSHENLWLDMFRYDLLSGPPADPAAWA